MPISDDELARSKNISVAQVEQLRMSRGATNDTLDGLSDAALRRAIRRLGYPDLALERARFRLEQERSDDGSVPTDALPTALAVRAQLALAGPGPAAAGVPVAPTRPGPGG